MLLGSLVLHTGLEQHDATEGPTQVFRTNHGPANPLCAEAAQATHLPTCPACILQAQSLGAASSSALPPVGLVRLGVASVVERQPLGFAAPRQATSRGPPLA
jgi:hypothetical protein